jgi:Zn finger protein HypA/HybF involved in hydrogenase expression
MVSQKTLDEINRVREKANLSPLKRRVYTCSTCAGNFVAMQKYMNCPKCRFEYSDNGNPSMRNEEVPFNINPLELEGEV